MEFGNPRRSGSTQLSLNCTLVRDFYVLGGVCLVSFSIEISNNTKMQCLGFGFIETPFSKSCILEKKRFMENSLFPYKSWKSDVQVRVNINRGDLGWANTRPNRPKCTPSRSYTEIHIKWSSFFFILQIKHDSNSDYILAEPSPLKYLVGQLENRSNWECK